MCVRLQDPWRKWQGCVGLPGKWPLAREPTGMNHADEGSPMLVLVSGILLLGGIAAFIGWGLTHAYPAS